MKSLNSVKLFFTSVTVMSFCSLAFSQIVFPNNRSQNLDYDVHGIYSRSVKKEKLIEAKSLSDIMDDYPKNWITSYVSVEILVINEGKTIKAVSANDKLTSEQKNILNTVNLASDVVINIKYTYKEPITKIVENNTMHVSMTVVPETEAEYVGGNEQIIKYLKEKTSTIISEKNFNESRLAVRFVINEGGEITNAKMSDTSGDPKADKLLLEVIRNMPNWRPAKNLEGINVKQEFEFRVYRSGC